MDTTDQQPTPSQAADNGADSTFPSHADVLLQEPQPKRRRSLRGRIRRAVRILEPFALMVGLGLLSAGVIEVVETQVPTRGDQDGSVRLARAETQSPAEQRTFPGETAPVWRASDLPDAQATEQPDPTDPLDHSTISINSTSNTSAAPPGMLGGRPASP